jgi:hypothetical protein
LELVTEPAGGPSSTPSTSRESGEGTGELGAHYERMRRRYPDDELCIVFDIDGTILDPRYLIVDVLLAYDREHGTEHFHGLRADDVTVPEENIDELLADRLALPLRADVRAWFEDRRRSAKGVASAYRPHRGALAVVRWFTLLPHTHVALNTGRPDRLRAATLESLNAVGRNYRVTFDPGLLCMNPGDWASDVRAIKVAGLRTLESAGLRIVAVVDSEPAEIQAMAAADDTGDILFVRADTLFRATPDPSPRPGGGREYDIAGLVSEEELARRVEFVWHGVNDPDNLREFLASAVRWAEVDVRRDPLDRIVLRHDSFDITPWHRAERPFLLDDCLAAVRADGRAAKLDFKEGGEVLERALTAVERLGFEDTSLWFNSNIDCLGQQGFEDLRSRYPQATISCPVDFLAPLVLAVPEAADAALAVLGGCGVSRLSLAWTTSRFHDVLERLESLDWDVNIYALPNLAAFVEAALLIPRSLTADFNFPEWDYHGRGSGEGGGLAGRPLPDDGTAVRRSDARHATG